MEDSREFHLEVIVFVEEEVTDGVLSVSSRSSWNSVIYSVVDSRSHRSLGCSSLCSWVESSG